MKKSPLAFGLLCLLLTLLVATMARAEFHEAEHPFILWNKADIDEVKKTIDKEQWAKARYEALKDERGAGQTHRNLFRYLVEGDRSIIEGELKDLRGFAGAGVDTKRPWADNHLVVLRYDVLYDLLTAEERKGIEDTFRKHIQWELDNDRREYGKPNWLPNMQHPRKLTAHLMAAALQDTDLIEAIWAGNGGLKYYFDDYISDGQFYNEEFGKQYSTVGKMMLWCRAMERLGMDDHGYGYVGTGGATMQKYLQSYYTLGLPAVDLGTGRYHFPRFTLGDAKGGKAMPGYAFQQPLLPGYLTNGQGGAALYETHNMNGRDFRDRKVDQFVLPGWFELAHARWPNDGFGWFLYQNRKPGEDCYVPSLLFGHQRICEGDAEPPKVESFVAPERGIAMLRMEASPDYWMSPRPAVGMRLATPYMHEVPDVFALTGYYAFNRPIYINSSAAGGYAGVDPGWSNSIRSHASVMVDNLEPARIGQVPTRSLFDDEVKYISATGEGIYPGVKQARSLVLTDDYLIDVFHLESDRPRAYTWMIHTLGQPTPLNPDAWASTRHLIGSVYDVENERSSVVGSDAWGVVAVQATAGADPEFGGLGESWFKRRVGVRMRMIGEPGTIAYLADAPAVSGNQHRTMEGAPEPGPVSILAQRTKPTTTFIAIHEPFEGGFAPPRVVEVLAENDEGIVLMVVEKDLTAAIYMLAKDGTSDKEVAISSRSGTFRFTGFGYVRGGQGVDDRGGTVHEFDLRMSKVQADRYKEEIASMAKEGAPADPAKPQAAEVVTAETTQVWPGDFVSTVRGPRYAMGFHYWDDVSARVLLDPLGNRRYASEGRYPEVLVYEADGGKKQGEGDWKSQKLGGYQAFGPRSRKDGDETYYEEQGQHPHGYSSPLAWEFRNAWALVRYKPGEAGQEIAIDWNRGEAPGVGRIRQIVEERDPPVVLWADAGGVLHEGEPAVKEGDPEPEVRAVFRKPSGYTYGTLSLYPPESHPLGSQIAQPADQPMGFTFVKQDEVEALIQAWLKSTAKVEIEKGDLRDAERDTTPS